MQKGINFAERIKVADQLILRWETHPDYPGGPNVITRVLIIWKKETIKSVQHEKNLTSQVVTLILVQKIIVNF